MEGKRRAPPRIERKTDVTWMFYELMKSRGGEFVLGLNLREIHLGTRE